MKSVTLPSSSQIPAPNADMVLLRANGLRMSYGGQVVLRDVNLDLRRGEVVLLRGDNGSGKTTLLNILTGYVEPDAGTIELQLTGTRQTLAFPRKWWSRLNPFDRFSPERMARAGVGRSWQDMRLFPSLSLLQNVASAMPHQSGENPMWALLARRSVRRQETANRNAARAMLADLGLSGRETSSADCVSLGQAKRVAIARAVHAGAKILFLDEPLSGLDADGIEHVLDLLRTLADRHGVTLVIVEHVFHTQRLLPLATKVWTLAAGMLHVTDPVSLQAGNNCGKDGIAQWLNELAFPHARGRDLDLQGGARLTVRSRNLDATPVLLDVHELVVTRSGRPVVGRDGGLSFQMHVGDVAVLQAPNGWGKTTLLEALAGLLPMSAGTVHVSGRQLDTERPWQGSRTELAMLQARGQGFTNLTVEESLSLAGADRFLGEFGSLIGRKVGSLSGGERQKVALRSVLGRKNVKLLLLDEPFGMLDRDAVSNACRVLSEAPCSCVLIVVPAGAKNDKTAGVPACQGNPMFNMNQEN